MSGTTAYMNFGDACMDVLAKPDLIIAVLMLTPEQTKTRFLT